MKHRPYQRTDWPESRRKVGGEKISKRRKPPPTPIEEWIDKEKKKDLDRPFDDPLPF